jgi:hypothetical protein
MGRSVTPDDAVDDASILAVRERLENASYATSCRRRRRWRSTSYLSRATRLEPRGCWRWSGFRNTDYREASVTARLHVANPEKARGRVLAALSGEPFTVDEAREE